MPELAGSVDAYYALGFDTPETIPTLIAYCRVRVSWRIGMLHVHVVFVLLTFLSGH